MTLILETPGKVMGHIIYCCNTENVRL